MPAPIESPCIAVCQLRKGEDICRGCYRTLEEIGNWSRMTPVERRTIMHSLPDRHRDKKLTQTN
ncbi:MAG: DUF1289 domain-containing protein [Proteobacteria bacterium]|nr:DUF1289 domain-containing protein [Pseudomonadota bacterium]